MPKEKLSDRAPVPSSSLRSRFLGRKAVEQYFKRSGRYDWDPMAQGLFVTPEDERAILRNPKAREIITNDGKSTYVVHATTQAVAESIAQHELGIRAWATRPKVPDLESTTKMLAKHNEPGSVVRNTHALAYRYYGDGSLDGSFKVVAELSMPNPGTSLRDNPYSGTALERADGINIVGHDDPGQTEHGMPFSIPPERILGVFNVATGDFIPNEHFVPLVQHSGTAAGQQSQ